MISQGSKIRVFLGKLGLDGQDRGVLVVGQALREAGMEVIYSGPIQMPENIVEAVIQEDVHVLGLNILSRADMELIPRIMELLEREETRDILVLVGGVVRPEDIPKLKDCGVAEVFKPGADTREIVSYIREWWERE